MVRSGGSGSSCVQPPNMNAADNTQAVVGRRMCMGTSMPVHQACSCRFRSPSRSAPQAEQGILQDLGHRGRSEERRVGKECVSTCRSRWLTYAEKKKEPTVMINTN